MTGLVPPPLHSSDYGAPKRRRLGRWILLLVVIAFAGTGASYWYKDRSSNPREHTAGSMPIAVKNDTTARAPTGIRVKVRVVNTTKADGLAKKATALLRDRGFDVVDYEGDSRKPLDSTLVLTHTGHADWSERVVRALGVGTIAARPDTLRYLDVTVMIGRDWKAPAQPFRP